MMKTLYQYEAEVIHVVDGDTLDVIVDLGFKIMTQLRLRLLFVDTPEIYGVKHGSEEYERGREASAFTHEWLTQYTQAGPIGDQSWFVTIRTAKGTGKYGRWLAEVWPSGQALEGGKSLNDALIAKGYGIKEKS
jgi:micrococcal nuclease